MAMPARKECQDVESYMTGGAGIDKISCLGQGHLQHQFSGYVLSRGAVRKFGSEGIARMRCLDLDEDTLCRGEDVNMGKCMQDLEV